MYKGVNRCRNEKQRQAARGKQQEATGRWGLSAGALTKNRYGGVAMMISWPQAMPCILPPDSSMATSWSCLVPDHVEGLVLEHGCSASSALQQGLAGTVVCFCGGGVQPG